MNVILFGQIIAWAILIISALMFGLKILMHMGYTDLEKMVDSMKGIRRNYLAGNLKYLIAIIICIAFLCAV